LRDIAWPSFYEAFPGFQSQGENFNIRAIHWDDRIKIRIWRNEQLEILRQQEPISESEQDAYFKQTLLPQMSSSIPQQVLVSCLSGEELIGYGGLVHIDWSSRSAEVSFLSKTARSYGRDLVADWETFLDMLIPLAKSELKLHRLTVEVFKIRVELIEALEKYGFSEVGSHSTWKGLENTQHKNLYYELEI